MDNAEFLNLRELLKHNFQLSLSEFWDILEFYEESLSDEQVSELKEMIEKSFSDFMKENK